MRNLAILFLIISFSFSAFAQDPKKTNFGKNEKPKSTKTSEEKDEKAEFEKAVGEADAAKRVLSLQKFLEDFPESQQKERVLGLIVSGRAELAEIKFQNNEYEEGVKLFKLAVAEAPTPVSDDLFSRVLMQIPNNLFWRGERAAAFEVAKLIEEKIGADSKQMIGLAAFHISIENAADAIRLLNKSIEKAPDSSVAFQTLGLAYRMNFDPAKSVEAYQKSLELDPANLSAKRYLAEMKRATGKTDEAIKLYEELLEADAADLNAKTGLILSRFDAGNVVEAELAMRNFLVDNPNNLPLLVGAAYFFATKGDGEQAVDYSQKALAVEPRYVWAYITLARGYLLQGEPVLAERTLLTARRFGNFPTLQYELATARLAAGFYRDAADELKANFTLKDGKVQTNLGGRLEMEAESFTELLSLERQSSIFQPASADDAKQAERLKKLLKFTQKLEAEEADETAVIEAADEFIKGDDKMKTHRQIFVAGRLLEKKKALPKVLEITKEAVRGVDAALDVKNASAAVLADELYEPRRLAEINSESLVVPELPRQTLAAVIRGRIEALSGSALFGQDKTDEALIRMKRAVSVFPKESAWSRAAFWRMGEILQVQGKREEALDNFIRGYLPEEKNEVKKLVIETLYKSLNGSLEGLQARLETKPSETTTASLFTKKEESKEVKTEPTPEVSDEDVEDESPSEMPATDEIPAQNETDEETDGATIPEDLNLDIKLKPVENPAPTPEVTSETEAKTETVTDENKTDTENPSVFDEPKIEDKTVAEEIKTEDLATDADEPKTEETSTKTADETISDEVNAEEKAGETRETETPTDETNETETPPDETQTATNDVKTEPENTEVNAETEKPKVPEKEIVNPAEMVKKPKSFGRPVLIIEDQLTKTKTESRIGEDEETDKKEAEKTDEKPSEEAVKDETPSSEEIKEDEVNKTETVPADIQNPETEKKDESGIDKPKTEEVETEDTIADEEIPAAIPSEESASKDEKTDEDAIQPDENAVASINAGATRPRIVPADQIRKAEEETPADCKILITQEVISIMNNGGSMGILIGVEKPAESLVIKAVSSSPEDIDVIFEPGIGAEVGRAFFVIRSVSPKTGEFKVTFETPCGKKEILVKVR